MKGSDILVNCLSDSSATYCFGYPGNMVLDLYESLRKRKAVITHVLTADERGAAMMADGYARISGKLGVVIATSGPGATNLVTGIAGAFMDNVPLLAVCGNVPTYKLGTDSFQETDIMNITTPITKYSVIVKDVAALEYTAARMVIIATTGRQGPVLIDVPQDVQQNSAPYYGLLKAYYQLKLPTTNTEYCLKALEALYNSLVHKTDFSLPAPCASRAEKLSKAIEQAAALINENQRVVILSGGGVVRGNAYDSLIAFAQKLNAPVVKTVMGATSCADMPENNMGILGGKTNNACTYALSHCDLVVAVGCRFGDRIIKLLDTGVRLLHVDIDDAEVGKLLHPASYVVGDAAEVLTALLPLVEEKSVAFLTECRGAKARSREEEQDDSLTIRTAIQEVNRHPLSQQILATDVGAHQLPAIHEYKFLRRNTLLTSGGLGAMGFGLPAAIGAFLATGKRILLVTGDGGFNMTMSELLTAKALGANITILLINNGKLQLVAQKQQADYKHCYATALPAVWDYASVAKAVNAKYYAVTDLCRFATAYTASLKESKLCIIDCII